MGVMLMSTTCFAAGFILCEMQIDTILWGGYNKKIVLPEENIYFSKTDESL